MTVNNYTEIEEIHWASVKAASLELISFVEIFFCVGVGVGFCLFVFTVGTLVIVREMISSLIRELLR